MDYNQLINKIAKNGYIITDTDLFDSIIGEMIGKTQYDDIMLEKSIPDTDEFYEKLLIDCTNFGVLKKERHRRTMQMYEMTVDEFFPLFFSRYLTNGLTNEFPNEDHENRKDDDDEATKHWKDSDLFVKDILNNENDHEKYIQNFCTKYSSEPTLKEKLTVIFNKIPFLHNARQKGIDKDVITLAIKYMNGGISNSLTRNDFIRDSSTVGEVMGYCENFTKKDSEEDCCFCCNKIKDKKMNTSFVPFRCKHEYCTTCMCQLQTTAVGDYCIECRQSFKTT